jgi:hypothetical protein
MAAARNPAMTNDGLQQYLESRLVRASRDQQASIVTVLDSLSRCPIQLDLSDAVDLIGVDAFVEEILHTFFEERKQYHPRQDSIAFRMLEALYRVYPRGMGKAAILIALHLPAQQQPVFRPRGGHKDAWDSMKTLVHKGIVAKEGPRNSLEYVVTSAGLITCDELFGPREMSEVTIAPPASVRLVLSETGAAQALSHDLMDIARRTGLEYQTRAIEVGSVWFERSGITLDAVVSIAPTFEESALTKLARAPFKTRILIVLRDDSDALAEKQLKASRVGVSVIALRGPSEVALFLCEAARLAAAAGPRGDEERGMIRVGDVWQRQLRFLPGIGPSLAANLAQVYPTPALLMEALAEGEEVVSAAVRARWGRTIPVTAMGALWRLFGPQ